MRLACVRHHGHVRHLRGTYHSFEVPTWGYGGRERGGVLIASSCTYFVSWHIHTHEHARTRTHTHPHPHTRTRARIGQVHLVGVDHDSVQLSRSQEQARCTSKPHGATLDLRRKVSAGWARCARWAGARSHAPQAAGRRPQAAHGSIPRTIDTTPHSPPYTLPCSIVSSFNSFNSHVSPYQQDLAGAWEDTVKVRACV